MDFGLVPPEILSTLMYTGPGPGPIATTAAAWDGIAAELDAASTSYGLMVNDLATTSWLGVASEEMISAVTPYLSWMRDTAAQAVETAAQIRGGIVAYEEAFAATVPPSVIEANRAELMALLATNIFGQNAAAIAANQAEYAEMWAQDVAAMYDYAAAASTATRLTSFTPPPRVADGGGSEDSAEPARAADAGDSAVHQGMRAVPQVLQQLAMPAQAGADAVADDVLGEVATATAVSGLSLGSAYHGAISSANFVQRAASQFVSQFSTSSAPSNTDIMERVNRIGVVTGAIDPQELDGEAGSGHLGLGGFGDWHNWEQWLRQVGSRLGHAFLSAQTGQASAIGGLSVPHAWTAVPPEVQLAALDTPDRAAEAGPGDPEGTGSGVGGLLAATAAAGMVGRVLAGATDSREAGAARAKQLPQAEPATATVSELRERAQLLREYAELRDAGLLSDAEFNEQKRQLMSAGIRLRGS